MGLLMIIYYLETYYLFYMFAGRILVISYSACHRNVS